MPTFKHSGDIGDIIYSCPTIRALGGGKLYLNPTHGKLTKMTTVNAEALIPLLKMQEYIPEVEIWHNQPIDYDLDTFRLSKHNKPIHLSYVNLADVHLEKFGRSTNERNTPWLKIDPTKCDMLVHRSVRYRNRKFCWKRLLDAHKDKNINFVGLENEHKIFCKEIREIPFLPTPNFLELAKLLAGCNLFVGNQSAPLAIAIGLGINIEVEIDPTNPNCKYYLPNIKNYEVYPPSNGYRLV